jgi:ferrochelatase
MNQKRLGVVLLNMGGPETPSDVPAYLQNIFQDPAILDLPLGFIIRPFLSRLISAKRSSISAERYREIGGRTPLTAIARKQASVMREAFSRRGVDAVVQPAMRYWPPRAREAVGRLSLKGVEQVAVISMYPAYCSATTGSSLRNFQEAMTYLFPGKKATVIDRWPELDQYATFLSEQVLNLLKRSPANDFHRIAVLFSAHSVPVKLIKKGDPYKSEIESIFHRVKSRLPEMTHCALGWQSAVGPTRWLTPDSKSIVENFSKEGLEHLLVVPLGFAAENIETVWDIDIDLKRFANALGFKSFARVSCPNDDPFVMDALVELVINAIEGERNAD